LAGKNIVRSDLFFDKSDLKYIGKNVIIGKTVRIRQPEKVSIGDNTIIDDFTYISSEAEIGSNCHIASNVSISGGLGKLIMGDYSTLSSGTSVHCCSSDYRSISLDLPSVPKDKQFGGEISTIKIFDFVTVGAHSCILPGSVLPKGSAYGAYTLISKKKILSPYHLYIGKNCKDLGKREGIDLLNEFESSNSIGKKR
tara:strand:- start:2828 stop:3418 length:591 start_codon:yes stop_codon:yes gene_type:complete